MRVRCVQRASVGSALARAVGSVLGALSLALAFPIGRAGADDVLPAGAITGHFLIADGDVGGGLVLDVWAAAEWFRIGGFFVVAATPSDRDEHNRVLMSVGSVVAVDGTPARELSVQVRFRLGPWGGATQSEKLTGGIFVGGGVQLGYRLGGGVVASLGLDLWGVVASDAWRDATTPDETISASVLVVAPAIGLSWIPGGGE